MIVEHLLPPGRKPPLDLTVEDRIIIQRRRAGLMVLFDRLDAVDMMVYGALRAQGAPKEILSIGVSRIVDKLEDDFHNNVRKLIREAEGEPKERPPTIQ